MRTFFSILLMMLFTFVLNAQELNVPGKVKESFKKLYPTVSQVNWSKEGNEEFEASFTSDGKDISLVFENDGELIETETAIKLSELPSGVINFVEKNYTEYSITEAAKIVNSEGVMTFEAEVSKDNVRKDLLFTESGKYIEKNKSENESEDED
jgi:hypothetical protein